MKATIVKGWDFYYLSGATMHEFQLGRFCVSFLKFAYYWWPRRHFASGRWEFPRVIQFSIESKEDSC